MSYESHESHDPQPQAKEITPVEGGSLPQVAAQTNSLEDKIKQALSVCNDIKHKKVVKIIEESYKNGLDIILHDINSKKPNWMGMSASTYKADLQRLLDEYMKNPSGYGYGVVVGKQHGGFYLVAIDVDIDTEECKENISRELETRLTHFGIHYYKELTKTNRIHYYILLDKITPEIENISKLQFTGKCFKIKDGKEVQGEIEVFAKKNHFIIIYDGIINDKEPFTTTSDLVINNYIWFLNFLRDWIRSFASTNTTKDIEPAKEPQELVKEPSNEPEIKNKIKDKSPLFSKIVEAYKIIRNHNIINGWEIEKTFSAYCIRENIHTEQTLEGFKAIYNTEYDEKRTPWLLETTKKKDLALLPSLGSVHYHISKALQSKLSTHEKEVLENLLADLELNGYSDYKLPEYLKNAENVILYESSEKTTKENKIYYEESYFIELYDDEIKEVIFVIIASNEYKGIYKPHKLVSKKTVSIKTDIIRGVKESKFQDYEYLLNDKIVYRPTFNYSKVDDLVYDLGLISMRYNKFTDLNLYKRYLDKKTKMYVRENHDPMPCTINRETGWDDDFTGFWHPSLNSQYHELHRDHVLYRKKKDKVLNKDAQHDFVKSCLQEGKLLGALLTISVASLLIKPLNIPGFTTIISGNTGSGKTTASLIATSLFYYSDDHLLDAQSSKVGLELMIASLNSLPVLIDEAALASTNFTLQDLIFMVSSGKGKTRGRKDLSVDYKDLNSNVFWTTETTDIDEVRRSGAFRRSIYLVVDSWNDFTSLFKPEDRINELYAGCGIDYIQYLIEHLEEIKNSFKEQTKGIYNKYTDIATIALNLYAGLILFEAYYNTKFDKLRRTIDKLLDETKARFIDSRDNVTIQVMDFLESVVFQRFHVINGYRRDTDVLDIQYARSQESFGEYDKDEGTYYLTSVGLKAIADKLGKNKTLLLNELEKSGVLLARNVPYYFKSSKGKGKVHKLKFHNLKDDEPSPEQPPSPEPPPETNTTIDEPDDVIVDAFSKATYEGQPDRIVEDDNDKPDDNYEWPDTDDDDEPPDDGDDDYNDDYEYDPYDFK